MENFKKIAKIALKDLSSDLAINHEFIVEIHNEKSSWSFISKFAQLIEGFFTKILVQRLDEKDTYDTISNLTQAVRLNLAYDLKLISKEQKYLFLTVAEIRNDYIHEISNVEVNLADYIGSLKPPRRNEIYKRFKPFILDERIESCEDFCLDCINSIFTACILEIARINRNIEGSDAEWRHAEFRAIQALKLLPKKSDDSMFMKDKWMVEDFIKAAKKVLLKAGLLTAKFESKK